MVPDAFFGLVDEFLTPAMLNLGYHRIGGYRNDEPRSRAVLTTLGAPSSDDGAPFLVYDFGYEAGSHDAQRLVDPEDPESAEELWLSYEPVTGELDLNDWEFVARERVDWDPRTDSGSGGEHEVRRRLAAVGAAVVAFAQSQGGPSSTS